MTLEAVSQLFTVWRSSKQGHRSLIPEPLWAKVKLLQPHYSRAKICKTLHISYAQFNKHCEFALELDAVMDEQENFIEVATSVAPPFLCELVLKGARRTLTLKVPDTKLNHLLPLLEAYL